MDLSSEKLRELLVESDVITEKDFKAVEQVAKKEGVAIDEILIEKGLLLDAQLGQLIAEEFGFRFTDVSKEKIDNDIFFLIPEVVAREQHVVALSRLQKGIKVAMINPLDQDLVHLLEKRLGEKVIPYVTTRRSLEYVWGKYSSDIRKQFHDLVEELTKLKSADAMDEIIVSTVDMLLRYGYHNRASDIHIEPFREKVVVRFRVDGVLYDVLDMEKKFLEPVLSRLKVMAKMRTDEHRAAQDGKLSFTTNKEEVDVRVSVVPTTNGEKTVMRLLAAKSRQFTLADLGFSDEHFAQIKKGIKIPHGMILATGPTGSGKTTTLYAMLKILNKREVNIATIEDPVEYDIESIAQIQVNPKTNLTFAQGLRSIVRQDPDIIMVGEIRDPETANIAVNSALTGHLVLSTLHTNDAATTLPRLIDMKVEPFLVASTVNIIIAQRLVRKICTTCIMSRTLSPKEKASFSDIEGVMEYFKKHGATTKKAIRVYQGKGCSTCGDTGYTGRVGLFEVMEVSEQIRALIMRRANVDEIKKQAIQEGMISMLEDGVQKVISGATTLEEVLRVARD
ncbi:MAG: GspE/PulE family protein [Candidatus Magasanikbacteria bacterium]